MKCCITDKSKLRKTLKAQRTALSKDEILKMSKIICERIYAEISNYSSILCYVSHMGEVDLTNLISRLLAEGKAVSVPVCTLDTNIIPAQIESSDFEFYKNLYNICEPKIYKKPKIFPDCCLVPGIGFDKSGNRVGHGKGYYDRFLAENPMFKIGVCYDFQIANKIDASEFDVKMDCVISEKRIF